MYCSSVRQVSSLPLTRWLVERIRSSPGSPPSTAAETIFLVVSFRICYCHRKTERRHTSCTPTRSKSSIDFDKVANADSDPGLTTSAELSLRSLPKRECAADAAFSFLKTQCSLRKVILHCRNGRPVTILIHRFQKREADLFQKSSSKKIIRVRQCHTESVDGWSMQSSQDCIQST